MTIASRPQTVADLPASHQGLQRLATNFWWTWNPAAADVLRELDPVAAQRGVHPLTTLLRKPTLPNPEKVQAAVKQLDAYLDQKQEGAKTVAYFCAEYGLHESFPQYSGGLGILAGDHCKEASDMRLPFVAVGCFYSLGFFQQVLDPSGRQEHLYPLVDRRYAPLEVVLQPGTDQPLTVQIPFPGRTVTADVLVARVGRVPLLLLDTNIEANTPEDRAITAQLYTRGRAMRLCQETVLGVGGAMALEALGIQPTVFHMNEGHSALLLLHRLGGLLKQGHTLKKAKAAVQATSILTIHTPVTAGNERFDSKLFREILQPTLDQFGLKSNEILKAGLGDDNDPKVFDMTAFALRHSRDANGVSLLHGETADKTWRKVVGLPVRGLTNGVHMPTWLGPEIAALTQSGELEAKGGRRKDWVGELADDALWQAHRAQKNRMVEFVNRRAVAQFTRYGQSPDELRPHLSGVDPEAFVIGFARRFATYKRASLLFRDPKRLAKLIGNPDRPVQVVFAGKAHPADGDGQALIAEVFQFTQDPRFKGKVFLVEDYEMEVGRMLVQGVDLWLNNPRRPLEASGTSGMKAAANGIPNCSVLDGWWDEAYEEGDRRNGFAIGKRTNFRSVDAQDKADGAELYRVLEQEVLPLYFGDRAAWIQVMRQSIRSSVYAFSTRRMLEDYVVEMY